MAARLLLLALPGAVAQVRLADVDGDGREEIIAAVPDRAAPPAATTLVVAALEAGALTRRDHALPGTAAWWDAGHGLWTVDGRGLSRLGGPTLLPTAAPAATPAGTAGQATLVHDLDADGTPELLVWMEGHVVVATPGGARWGRAAAPGRASLEVEAHLGGQSLTTHTRSPAVATGDVDGDGIEDLLLTSPEGIAHHRIQAGVVGPAARWPLPSGLRTLPGDRGEITDAHWADLDADGRVDLLVHRVRTDGRLAGTEAELHLHRGTGSGLGPAQVRATGAGSEHAFPVDLDGDGRREVLIPQVSLDVGNLAQAVLSRSVEVTLVVHRIDAGGIDAGTPIHAVSLPLESGAAAWSLFGDHDGDGHLDLATAVGGVLRVHPGAGLQVARRPAWTLPLPFGVANLWACDLDGDGRDELVGWTPGHDQLLVVLPP